MVEMAINWEDVITLIREGVETTAKEIENNSEEKKFAQDLRANLPFFDQINEWIEKLPQERIHTSVFSILKKIDTDILGMVRKEKLRPDHYGSTEEYPSARFIQEAVVALGPQIVVSADSMKVHAVIEPEFVHLWDAEKLKAGLDRHGIQGTILEKGIEAALSHPGKSFNVAHGSAPVVGQDAAIEDCLGLDLDGIPMSIDRNRVDLKSLNWVHNVVQNQVLLKKKPATPGIPGNDVYGNEISCRDGVDIPFPEIANTGISEDGLSLISAVDGCAYKEGKSIVVVPTLDINSNVDFSTGHVSAEVTVNVGGDVLSGFRVESNHDIHVKGTIESSRLNAKGSIFLPGGIQGKSDAVIASGKNIEAKFINAAQVLAKGEIIVHGSIIQSKVRAQRVELRERGAEIIGGVIEAEEDVCADIFGSDIGVKTVIRLGHDLPELTDKIEKIEEQIKQLEEKKQQTVENLDKLDRIQKQVGTLTSAQVEVKEKSKKNLKKIEEAIETHLGQLEKTQESLSKAQEMRRTVRARKNILPGVEIVIQGHTFTPKTSTGPLTVFAANEKIETLPFEERTFASEEEVDE